MRLWRIQKTLHYASIHGQDTTDLVDGVESTTAQPNAESTTAWSDESGDTVDEGDFCVNNNTAANSEEGSTDSMLEASTAQPNTESAYTWLDPFGNFPLSPEYSDSDDEERDFGDFDDDDNTSVNPEDGSTDNTLLMRNTVSGEDSDYENSEFGLWSSAQSSLGRADTNSTIHTDSQEDDDSQDDDYSQEDDDSQEVDGFQENNDPRDAEDFDLPEVDDSGGLNYQKLITPAIVSVLEERLGEGIEKDQAGVEDEYSNKYRKQYRILLRKFDSNLHLTSTGSNLDEGSTDAAGPVSKKQYTARYGIKGDASRVTFHDWRISNRLTDAHWHPRTDEEKQADTTLGGLIDFESSGSGSGQGVNSKVEFGSKGTKRARSDSL